MQLHQAKRSNVKIKIGIQGPSGSGKTKSALLLAYGITNDWTKIAIVDTENQSSELYANLGPFNVVPLFYPYTPEKFKRAIQICMDSKMEVIILDSISAEWQSVLHDHASLGGNSFTNWSKMTPRHRLFIETIIQSDVHIICTIRSKQAYVLIERNGKQIPEKVGMKPVQRDDIDYELSLVFQLSMNHCAKAIKDRTELFADQPEFAISPDTGKLIREWCVQDKTTEKSIISQIEESQDIDTLREIYHRYPYYQVALKEQFNFRKQQLLITHE